MVKIAVIILFYYYGIIFIGQVKHLFVEFDYGHTDTFTVIINADRLPAPHCKHIVDACKGGSDIVEKCSVPIPYNVSIFH